MKVDDGLEDIRRIRSLEDEKLSVASYALLPNLKKGLFFAMGRDRHFFRLFSTQQRPDVFVPDAWPAPTTYHRPFCEHCDQWVVRSP